MRKEKWLYIYVYKPPRVKNSSLITSLENVLNFTHGDYKSTYILGDLNIDLLKKNADFKSFLDVYGFNNIIDGPTCFKGKMGSLIDVILTDSPSRVASTLNVNVGISDFHNFICAATKCMHHMFS